MADKTPPENETVQPSSAPLDPQDFPPYTMNPDELQAAGGRLADVDPDYAPDGSDQESQGSGPMPGEAEDDADPQEAAESAAAELKQRNADAGAAGSGDDTTGRVIHVPEPDGPVVGATSGYDEETGTPVVESATPDAGTGGVDEEGVTTPPEDESSEETDEDDPGNWTVAELKAELDARGVEYDSSARKADLVELVRSSG